MDPVPALEHPPSHRGRALRWVLGLAGGFGLLVVAALAYLSQPGVRPIPGSFPAADPGRLEAHVRALVALPRGWKDTEGLAAAFAYAERALAEGGATVHAQTFQVQGRKYRNLRASFGPYGAPRLVVGAHLDTAGGLPGADDNASGVAALLELARLLGEHPPKAPVELVVWTLEEPPFFRTAHMGSRHHAASLRAQGAPVKAAISLECVGVFKDAPGTQAYPLPLLAWVYPSEGNYIALVGRSGEAGLIRRAKAAFLGATDLPVQSINAPVWVQGIDFSDHASYWREGFPALMVTDTAFNRNRHYHTPADTPEKLDYRRMAKVVQGTLGVLEVLGKEDLKAP
jgi:hypothetical protein